MYSFLSTVHALSSLFCSPLTVTELVPSTQHEIHIYLQSIYNIIHVMAKLLPQYIHNGKAESVLDLKKDR